MPNSHLSGQKILEIFPGTPIGFVLTGGFRKTCQAQDWRGISVTLNSIPIHDEDDPLSSDEPYLIFIPVRGRVVGPDDARQLDANSIEVSLATNGHNNLGAAILSPSEGRRGFRQLDVTAAKMGTATSRSRSLSPFPDRALAIGIWTMIP